MKTAKEIYQYALGAITVIGVFLIVFILTRKEVPPANKDLLNIVIGSLVMNFGQIVGYFFGSSKSSSDKNDIIANSVPRGTTPEQTDIQVVNS